MTTPVARPKPDEALRRRLRAAHRLLDTEPGVDGVELLRAVVWPESWPEAA